MRAFARASSVDIKSLSCGNLVENFEAEITLNMQGFHARVTPDEEFARKFGAALLVVEKRGQTVHGHGGVLERYDLLKLEEDCARLRTQNAACALSHRTAHGEYAPKQPEFYPRDGCLERGHGNAQRDCNVPASREEAGESGV